ncbi:hypothetical protein A3Q56_08511 [Intoshia linei]|uniref:Uncharacterized protein n=1 Tax=Intoshia linei TaxID=1819745 RepID=A0A177AP03_9BILA|nr:hypothetical protein A3Q56_08511 [Intoshia linei]
MRYKFVSKFEMKYNKLADICLCLYSNQPEYILKAIKIKNIFIDNQYAVTTMECISRVFFFVFFIYQLVCTLYVICTGNSSTMADGSWYIIILY